MRAVDENLVVNKINVGLMCRPIKYNKLVILTVYIVATCIHLQINLDQAHCRELDNCPGSLQCA